MQAHRARLRSRRGSWTAPRRPSALSSPLSPPATARRCDRCWRTTPIGAFESAIAAREAAGETQRTEIHAIHSATIETADLRGTIADVTVRFVSDQVNLTLGQRRQPGHRHRCGDRNHRPLDLRARPDRARPDLAAGGRAQRLMRRTFPGGPLARLLASLQPFALAACVQPPRGGAPKAAMTMSLAPVGFDQLPGWGEEHPAEAVPAFLAGCAAMARNPATRTSAAPARRRAGAATPAQWRDACDAARAAAAGRRRRPRLSSRPGSSPGRSPATATRRGCSPATTNPRCAARAAPAAPIARRCWAGRHDMVQVDLGDFVPDLKGRRITGRLQQGQLVPYWDRAAIEARRARPAAPGHPVAGRPDRCLRSADPGLGPRAAARRAGGAGELCRPERPAVCADRPGAGRPRRRSRWTRCPCSPSAPGC